MAMEVPAWHVSFGDGLADCAEAIVAFTHHHGRARVYRITPKRPDVDERWAAHIADDATAAIAAAWRTAPQGSRPA